MFYAIVENGGKQYKASEGHFLEIDLLHDEVGTKKKFDQVLLLVNEDHIEIGTPHLNGVQVEATVVDHFKGEKVTIFKYRPKQRYRVKTGHRQKYSRLMVDAITYPGMTKKSKTDDQAVVEKIEVKAKTEKPAEKRNPVASKKETGKKSTTAAPKTAVKKIASKPKAAAAKKSSTKKSS
jgi:large subunit ribosomal protein L21